MEEFVRERDSAMTKAVMEDEWTDVLIYCKKYKIPVPNDSKIMKAGIYKAVQLCTSISDEVKDQAMLKCLELGLNPFFVPDQEKEKKSKKR